MASTNTPRYGLNKPTPGTAEPVGSAANLSASLDTVDLHLGSRVCTSSNKPGSPIAGMLIFETDTLAMRVWDAVNSKWRLVNPISAFDFIATAETTLSTTYVDLATVGPVVGPLYMTAGQRALVTTSARQNASASTSSFMSYAVSGTETVAAPNTGISIHEQEQLASAGDGTATRQSTFIASGADGNRTWTCKYHAGSAALANFRSRYMSVLLLSN